MLNSSDWFFVLGDYAELGSLKFPLFSCILLLYVLIVCANLLLIVVICVDRNLHQPMYMFLCSLFVNELYGSSALFPFLLVQLLSDVHVVSAPLCFLQIFCLYTYVNVEFYNLAVMSYDRYLAICRPLLYRGHMTARRSGALIAAAWLLPAAAIVVMIVLNASLRLCRNVIDRLICNNYYVVRLACGDTTVNNVYGLVYTFTVLAGLASLILYTYVQILRVCCTASRQTRQKALSTCGPHLASVLNFAFGVFFEIFQSRLDVAGIPNALRVFLSVYFITVQPLFNPLLYGINLQKIRLGCKTLFYRKQG